MRDTTKIMAIAQETISDLEAVKDGSVGDLRRAVGAAIDNQKEIVNTARRMDARTGKLDPSAKRDAVVGP